MKLPSGFQAAGRNLGIKNRKRDAGLILCQSGAEWAAVTTTNKSRAPNIDRIDELRPARVPLRAVLALSGNANALTGAEGEADDRRLAKSVAQALGVPAESVLTAYTGMIGRRLPVEKVEGGLGKLLADLGSEVDGFSEAILTTDRYPKVQERDFFVEGHRIRMVGVVKGAGMIAPSMATMLSFVTTDARVDAPDLQLALTAANVDSFEMLTVDDDMSTNDLVLLMANGQEGPKLSPGAPGWTDFVEQLSELLLAQARAVASDGEGATRRFEVQVEGAPDEHAARAFARGLAVSPLVKTALFGNDPNAGSRMVASAGAVAARIDALFRLEQVELKIQGVRVVESGVVRFMPPESREKLRADVIEAELRVGRGPGRARAFGCDFSYDYVKINADYADVVLPGPEASERQLAERSPETKRGLLIEALRYIEGFRGMRAVVKIGGAAMVEAELERQFAESVLLLRSVGLRPIVVHGGGPEISKQLDALGQGHRFVDGLRFTDPASMRTVEMVLSGGVNQRLVAALNRGGSHAVGLSGKDGGLLRARPIDPERLGRVGEVSAVDPRVLELLEQQGYVPVVSPVALAEDGDTLNVNADVVAAHVAAAVGAQKLIYLSDVPGLLDGEEVVSELDGDQLKLRLESGSITGGMKPKLESALWALRAGVSSVHLVDGRVPHNLIAELFTDRGVGTLIRRS
ncbi:MAG: bifunctional glutamate N-acetyltransferase/amino-acid acetyltransferase ArgJ [Myxococcota bacterium]